MSKKNKPKLTADQNESYSISLHIPEYKKEEKKEGNFLTRDEYFEWLTTIEQSNVASEKYKNAILEHKIIEKDIQILTMKLELNKVLVVNESIRVLNEHKKEYDRFLNHLESQKGFSIKGKIIDEFTFEVKDEIK